MKGATFKRCACKDSATGLLLDRKCPKLKSSKHGSWFYVVELPTGSGGKRRQQRRGGFMSQRAAEGALNAVVAQVAAGTYVDPGRLTVGQYLEEWLAGKGKLRPSTRASYRQHLSLYLKPALGQVRITDLRANHVEAMVQSLRHEPHCVGVATTRRVFATLRGALNKAQRQGLIAVNPCSFVELESEEEHRRPTQVWTAAQVGGFLDAISEHRLALLFELTVKAGLRRGEVIGLRWSDVDLDDAVMFVAQSVVQVGGALHVGTPKTKKSMRRVPLDDETVASLRAHRRRQLEERVFAGAGWKDTDRVFVRPDGEGLVPEYVSRAFRNLTRQSGLPPIRLHELRHTSASLALAAGVPMRVVSERLGHSTIGITQNLYTHVFDELSRDAADKIASLIPRRNRSTAT
jgi:integrase